MQPCLAYSSVQVGANSNCSHRLSEVVRARVIRVSGLEGIDFAVPSHNFKQNPCVKGTTGDSRDLVCCYMLLSTWKPQERLALKS